MDYEKALEILSRAVEGTESWEEFLLLEARLRENLEKEKTFGATPERSSQRFEILPGLNRMAKRHLGCSFNDLLLGRYSGAGLASPRVQKWIDTGVVDGHPTPEALRPPVEPRLQVLPFDQLTWEQFERLCAALVAAQPQVLDCHLYGLRGENQKGIDIVAEQQGESRRETWVYQCKRYREYGVGALREALDKITYPADFKVVFLSREAGRALRDEVKARGNVFLWDANDISRKLKNHPQLIEDFFGVAWRRAFNP
jgi:hypothetical protein